MPTDDLCPDDTSNSVSESEKVSRQRMLESFERLVKKGYAKKVDPDGSEYPVEVVYGDLIPVRGNEHLTLGRVLSRAEINKQFRR